MDANLGGGQQQEQPQHRHDVRRIAAPTTTRQQQKGAALAVLLAGQIRTFEDPAVHSRVVATSGGSASLFAHLSSEHSYASWHRTVGIPLNGAPASSSVGTLAANLQQLFGASLKLLTMQTDAELLSMHYGHEWVGSLMGDSQSQSLLMLRWAILLRAVKHHEAERGHGFKFVLRMRPDAVLLCNLPSLHAHEAAPLLGPYRAVASRDFVLLMDRQAADVALSAYYLANSSFACRAKVELCAPGLLVERNFSVGTMSMLGSLVRPAWVCRTSASLVGCSPDEIAAQRRTPAAQVCSVATAARPWNLTARLQFHHRSIT